ncbi:MAG: thiamine-phosphate kinase [Marinilabilia sp.]
MALSEIGEFGLIERFSKSFRDFALPGMTGIGDDCAIMPLDDQYEQVVTTDLLIEDIHFLRSAISPFDLGYKSLAVNLSDIAAMGGQPTGSFLSIALPPDMELSFMDGFIEGYRELSSKYNVPLLGGDTTKSPDKLVINVCVMGKTIKGKARKRSMARHGDVICVTGPLGDSGAGLKAILEDHDPDELLKPLLQWHTRPEPAVNEGLWLASRPEVHAMIDVSDGIASDLGHVIKSSEVGAHIDMEKVPVSDALKKAAPKYQWDATELALSAGEDYRLLLTLEEKNAEAIINAYNQAFPEPLTPVGKITSDARGGIEWFRNGQKVDFSRGGFNHFSG